MHARPPVLLLLDEHRTAQPLAHKLTLDGYEVLCAKLSTQGCTARSAQGVDLVILAPSTPATGLPFLRRLRAGELRPALDPDVLLLWICSHTEPAELLRASAAGADDVLRAPPSYAELLARVRALLRRRHAAQVEVLAYGPLRIDAAQRQVSFAGTPARLRRKEYELLVHLARRPGQVHSKQELLREVWGYRAEGPQPDGRLPRLPAAQRTPRGRRSA